MVASARKIVGIGGTKARSDAGIEVLNALAKHNPGLSEPALEATLQGDASCVSRNRAAAP